MCSLHLQSVKILQCCVLEHRSAFPRLGSVTGNSIVRMVLMKFRVSTLVLILVNLCFIFNKSYFKELLTQNADICIIVPGDFLCKDRRKCVDGNLVCDGQSHCLDGSDEMACYLSARTSKKVPLKCRVGSKPCNDGRECVLRDHVCDGEIDCKDGSDERGCPNRCNAGKVFFKLLGILLF